AALDTEAPVSALGSAPRVRADNSCPKHKRLCRFDRGCRPRACRMSEFLLEAARSSSAIAASLNKLRKRAEAAIRDAAIADTVLDARDPDSAGHARSSANVQPREHAPSTAHDLHGTREGASWSTDLLRDVAAPDVYA